MKRVFIDMDNVLVDFQSGLVLLSDDIKRQYEGRLDEIPGLFAKMKPMPGAIDAVHQLQKHYDLFILSTAPWKNPSAWSDKVKWVTEYLDDVFHKRIVITHRKDLCQGDYLIDDRGKNGTSDFSGEWIEFGSEKFPDWQSVLNYLIPQEESSENDDTIIFEPSILSETEKIEIAENAAITISRIIDAAQNGEDWPVEEMWVTISKTAFKMLKGKPREFIISLLNLQDIEANMRWCYNPRALENPTSEQYKKFEYIFNNWSSIIRYGANKLAFLEGSEVLKRNDSSFKDEDSDYLTIDGLDGEALAAMSQEERESTIKEYWMTYFRNSSSHTTLSRKIRRALERLLDLESYTDEDGSVKYRVKIHPVFDFEQTIDSDHAINSLYQWLCECETLEEMVVALKEKVKKEPWVHQILNILEMSDSNESALEAAPFTKQDFFSNFRKDFSRYSTVVREVNPDGTFRYYTYIMNTTEPEKFFLQETLSRVKRGQSSIVKYDEDKEGILLNSDEAKEEFKKKVEKFSSKFDEIQKLSIEIYKTRDIEFEENVGAKTASMIKEYSEKLSALLNDLEILTTPKEIENTINNTPRLLRPQLFGNRSSRILTALSSIETMLKKLTTYKVSEDAIDIFDRKEKNINMYMAYKQLAEIFAPAMQESIENSVYEDGKTYYAFQPPSRMQHIIRNLSDAAQKGVDAFEEYMQKNYKKFAWFFNDDPAIEEYRTPWLKRMAKSESLRKVLQHKIQLTHAKIAYKELNDRDYALSLMSEFFFDKNKKLAWYRAPIMSNKPSSEFIQFERYKLDTVSAEDGSIRYESEEILNGLIDVFFQEILRMKTTIDVGNKNNTDAVRVINRDFTEKFLENHPNLARKLNAGRDSNGKMIDPITLDDLFSEDGKLITIGTGCSFHFLPMLNDILTKVHDKLDDERDNAIANGIITMLNNGNSDLGSIDTNNNFINTLKERISEEITDIVALEKENYAKIGVLEKYLIEITLPQYTKRGEKLKESERTITLPYYKHLASFISSPKDIYLRVRDHNQNATQKELEEYYSKELESEVNDALAEYIWNDMFATINIIQITATDLSYFKNVEDFQKRYAAVHSPGVRLDSTAKFTSGSQVGERVSDGTCRVLHIQDENAISEIADNVKEIFDRKGGHFKIIGEHIYEILSKKGFNSTDGQGYSCPTSLRKKLEMAGKWNPDMERAYQNIRDGKYNIEDVNVLMQPLKPFITSVTAKRTGSRYMPKAPVPIQVKDSEYMLLLADAILRGDEKYKNNKLSAIFDFMEDSHYEKKNGKSYYRTDGIDTVAFVSTSKFGATSAVDLSDENIAKYRKSNPEAKDLSDEAIAYRLLTEAAYADPNDRYAPSEERYSNEYVHEIPFSDFAIQQEVPGHMQDNLQAMGSQMRILSVTNIRKDAKDIMPDPDDPTKMLNGEEFQQKYQEKIAENINDSLESLAREFKLDGKSSKTARNIKLSRILRNALRKEQKYDQDMWDACAIDPTTGDFALPISDPIQSIRFQQLIHSIIKKRINKQEFVGGPIVQASSFGLSENLNIVFKDKNGNPLLSLSQYLNKYTEKTREDYIQYIKENQAGLSHWEIYITCPSSELESHLREWGIKNYNDETYYMLNVDKAIEDGIIDESVVQAIGYRIPTEAKYSMAPMKVKSFLPRGGGEIIMMPKEITLLTGSKFDIDKMYMIFKDIYRKESEGKVKYTAVDVDNITEYGKTVNAERKHRNNKIFDMQWASLTYSENLEEMFTPGGFDTQKRTAAIIKILRTSENNYTYEELKNMSLEKLEEFSTSSTNLSILRPSTQIYFHNQNMVAGKLIGIFANNNVSHAFLSMQNIELDLKDKEFSLNGVKVKDNKFDAIRASDGKLISTILAEYLAASVDAVKEPVLNFMNLNTFTVTPAMVLARLGIDSDTIGLLMNQPIIREVTTRFFVENADGYISSQEIIKRTLIEIGKRLGLDLTNPDTVEALNNEVSTSSDFNKREFAKSLNLDINSDNISEEDLHYQLKILLLFNRLAVIGAQMQQMTFLTKFNSVSNAAGPNISDNLIIERRIRQFKELFEVKPGSDKKEALFNDNARDIIENSPILQAFYEGTVGEKGIARQILKPLFPHYSETISYIVSSIEEHLKSRLNSKDIDKIINDYIYFTMTNNNVGIIPAAAKDRLNFLQEMVTRFEGIKKKVKGNLLLNSIQIVPSNNRGKKCPIPTLSLATGSFNANNKNKYKAAWMDLLNSNNEELKQFAIDLYIYNIMRSSFGFSPKTFGHLAPTAVKLAVEKYRAHLFDFAERNEITPDPLETETFITQFLRNNAFNPKFVPTIDPERESIIRVVPDNNRRSVDSLFNEEVQPNSIAFTFEANAKKVLPKFVIDTSRLDNGDSYAKAFWYEGKLYISPEIKSTDDGTGSITVSYAETTPLGAQNEFYEYDANSYINMLTINPYNLAKVSEETKEVLQLVAAEELNIKDPDSSSMNAYKI